ncbi:hypothetical protein M2271_008109 [Streptomyces sp. LBL]|nr:hypothetical protein [Streptomyces sp. LBL]
MSPTARVTAAPRGTKRATTARARASPTWSRFQTAREKNRCARDQWAFPASPAACHIPVTVRGLFPDSTPVTSTAIVVNEGAVKHGRRTSSTINRDDGTVTGTWTSPV